MKKSFLRNIFVSECDYNESRTKFIHERIRIVEKHIPQLNNALKNYVKKSAGLRDYGDKVALALENYANGETVTVSMKEQLTEFASILLEIGSKRDVQVHNIESNVLEELKEYDKLCKHVQSELRTSIIANDKEKIRYRQLRRIQENNPQDNQHLTLAEGELIKARGEAARAAKSLEEQIDLFERKKLSNIKDILLAWTLAELHFHSKALQLFTEAYRAAAKMDVECNVEEFRNKLRTAESTPRLDTVRETTFQRSESVMNMLTMPFQRRLRLNSTGIPQPSPTATSSVSSLSRSTVSTLQ